MVPEAWPDRVCNFLQPCHHCDKLPCEFFHGLVEQDIEENESDLGDSACDTFGIGSDDSSESFISEGRTMPDKKPKGQKHKGK